MIQLKHVAILALAITAGCYPGISARDPVFFSEPPHIAAGNGKYFIVWRYGTVGCVFFPESKVVNGELLFSLHATTSSSCVPGRQDSRPITKPEHVRALETKGAFWSEPDGSKLKLEITESH